MTALSRKWLTIILVALMALPASGFSACHDDPAAEHESASVMHHSSMHAPSIDETAASPVHNHEHTACGDSPMECECMHLTGVADVNPPVAARNPVDTYAITTTVIPDFTPELVKPPPRSII